MSNAYILVSLLLILIVESATLNVLDTWTYDLPGVQEEYSTDVVIIDMFDTSKTGIEDLRNNGKTVICYMSAGSWEDWRQDKKKFKKVH